MSEKPVVRTYGPGVLGWLTIIFVVLKLNPGGHLTTDIVNWSWVWVLAPTWIPLAIVLTALFVAGVVWLVVKTKESNEEKNIRKARAALRDYRPDTK